MNRAPEKKAVFDIEALFARQVEALVSAVADMIVESDPEARRQVRKIKVGLYGRLAVRCEVAADQLMKSEKPDKPAKGRKP